MRGEAGAYIGYSETVHFAFREAIENCGIDVPCLPLDEVAVRRLPQLTTASSGEAIGWVDGLSIKKTLSGPEREAALKFITFATSPDAYKLVLDPEWMNAPRYLLPARAGLSFRSEEALYPDFLAAHAGRKTGTLKGLNERLHNLAGKLNCALPIDRTDTKSLTDCKRP